MSRFPPIPPSKQTQEQKEAHAELDAITQKTYGTNPSFKLKDEEGALLGPFAPLIYTPTLVTPWWKLGLAVWTLPSLTSRERELAILSVLSHTQAAYSTYAHTRLAEAAGLSSTQVADAREGTLPGELTDREQMVYEFASELARMRGPLGEKTFQEAKEMLGMESVAAIMHTVASFLYSSVLFNAADVPLPEGEKM